MKSKRIRTCINIPGHDVCTIVSCTLLVGAVEMDRAVSDNRGVPIEGDVENQTG